jgi:hypothetical protein
MALSRLSPILAGALAGCIAGVGAAAFFARREAVGHPELANPIDVARQRYVPVPVFLNRPENVTTIPEGELPLGHAALGRPIIPVPIATVEESKARHAAQESRALEEHRSEPVDEAWSQAAQASLRLELEGLVQPADARLGNIECRSTSCVATIEWMSYGRAVATYSNMVEHRYEPNCARSAYLPEPIDVAAPYQVQLIFSECVRKQL